MSENFEKKYFKDKPKEFINSFGLKNPERDLNFKATIYSPGSESGLNDPRTYIFEKDGKVISKDNDVFVIPSISDIENHNREKDMAWEASNSGNFKQECENLLKDGYHLKKIIYHPGSAWEKGKEVDSWGESSVEFGDDDYLKLKGDLEGWR